jgi:hypothetical protein
MMADRVSTIRFRAEGTQEIVSRVEELNRAIMRQQRELGNAVKVANQNGPGGADAIRLAQQHAGQLTRLQAMVDKEKRSQFDKGTEITDTHMRQVYNRDNAERAASDRMLSRQKVAMDKSAEQQYAAYAKNAAADTQAANVEQAGREKASKKLDDLYFRDEVNNRKAGEKAQKERIALHNDAQAADEKDRKKTNKANETQAKEA